MLDLHLDPIALTAALIDISSQSRHEQKLADYVYQGLQRCAANLEIIRDGNAVIARSHYGRAHRVIFAGHLDTVPPANNIPHYFQDVESEQILYGCGAVDMKSGDAVFLHLAATLVDPLYDVTYIFYDCEEIQASENGLARLEEHHPDLFHADLAILGEPTNSLIEAGCQGTLRAVLHTTGIRAHSARAWMGQNAIHKLAPVLEILNTYKPRQVTLDGCTYREGLSAVGIQAGIAGNVIPDAANITVNYRFAPDRSPKEAIDYLHKLFAHCDVHIEITDQASGALPGLSSILAQRFLTAVGTTPNAKYGWTDVARFAACGIPALNFGPGDPQLAHRADEHVPVRQITQAYTVLKNFLTCPSESAIL